MNAKNGCGPRSIATAVCFFAALLLPAAVAGEAVGRVHPATLEGTDGHQASRGAGSRNALGIVAPGLPADPTHQARKNRYISIDPAVNGGQQVAYKVTLASMRRCSGDLRRACAVDGDCVNVCENDNDARCSSPAQCGGAACVATGPCVEHPDTGRLLGWVETPFQEPLGCPNMTCANDDWIARVGPAPVFQVWTQDTLHIGDCVIVPVATYAIEACLPPDGASCSSALLIGTIEKPGFNKNFGDVAGPVDLSGNYTPPDRLVNVVDFGAYFVTVQHFGTAMLPQAHPTWIDLVGSGPGSPPNYIMNVEDLDKITFGYGERVYTQDGDFLDPAACPNVPAMVPCCLPAGTCAEMTPEDCTAAAGTEVCMCLGDSEPNGTDDACECPVDPPAQVLAEDSLATSCTSDTDCTNLATCIGGRCYVPRNRYISVEPGNAGHCMAIRVELTASADFPACTGLQKWVGPPDASTGIANLQDLPEYRDWGADPVVIHIGDREIVPVATYEVRAIEQSCDTGTPANFSPALTIATTPRPSNGLWADVVGEGPAGQPLPPPDGFLTLFDIRAYLFWFRGDVEAPPLTWLDLAREIPNGSIDGRDQLAAIDASHGGAYPGIGPCAPLMPTAGSRDTSSEPAVISGNNNTGGNPAVEGEGLPRLDCKLFEIGAGGTGAPLAQDPVTGQYRVLPGERVILEIYLLDSISVLGAYQTVIATGADAGSLGSVDLVCGEPVDMCPVVVELSGVEICPNHVTAGGQDDFVYATAPFGSVDGGSSCLPDQSPTNLAAASVFGGWPVPPNPPNPPGTPGYFASYALDVHATVGTFSIGLVPEPTSNPGDDRAAATGTYLLTGSTGPFGDSAPYSVPERCAELLVVMDCNGNGIADDCETDQTNALCDQGLCEQGECGIAPDCNANAIPDSCEIDQGSPAPGGPFYCDPAAPPIGLTECDTDCNVNGIPDACDQDCNTNVIPDDCEIDQNSPAPGGPFYCDPADPPPGLTECDPDCNIDGVPDACQADCNVNSVPDNCEIDENSPAPGGPFHCDPADPPTGITECDRDCNTNGVPDRCEIDETSQAPGGPFYCDPADPPPGITECDPDCNTTGIPDACDIADCPAPPLDPSCDDCAPPGLEPNGIPDGCDIADGTLSDLDGNGFPDECYPFRDCNNNTISDACELDQTNTLCNEGFCQQGQCGSALDCNMNGIPDVCDILDTDGGFCSRDCADCAPLLLREACETDCDQDSIPDSCRYGEVGDPEAENSHGVCCIDDNDCRQAVCNGDPQCTTAAVCLSGHCYVPKNRYLSFVPHAGAAPAAIRVQLMQMKRCGISDRSCVSDDDCIEAQCVDHAAGLTDIQKTWWVDVPFEPACLPGHICPPNEFAAKLVNAPVFTVWPAAVVHIGDCEVVPVATYEIRYTTNGVDFSNRLLLATTPKPNKLFGDTVGTGTGELLPWHGFTPPQGVVNVSDWQALILTMQGAFTPSIHTTWVDVAGDGVVDGNPPNFFPNVGDLLMLLKANQGAMYLESQSQAKFPESCPP